MADYDDYGNRRKGGFGKFLLGLILGLLLGLGGGYLMWKDNNLITTSATSGSTNQNSSNNSTQGKKLSNEQYASVNTYSQMLVEASREGVDVPSEEATASKAALTKATDEFLSVFNEAGYLKDNASEDDLESTLGGVNNSFLQYAGTARQANDQQQVDDSVKRLSNYLKQNAEVTNTDQFDATLVSFKNTVLESIRAFTNNNYDLSYQKQTEAQTELQKLLQNMQSS